MSNTNKDTNLHYHDSDGVLREVEDRKLTLDKSGRFWLWCDKLQHNLAYRAATKEDALLIAISSLLFTIQLKDERLKALERISNLAFQFANEIKPDDEDEY